MRVSGHICVRRAAIPDDLRTVRALFREYQRELEIPPWFSRFEQELAALPGACTILLVAELDGQPSGCAVIRPLGEEGSCELKRFWLRSTARGKGIWRELLNQAIELAAEAGLVKMTLDILPDRMSVAIPLLGRWGFSNASAYRAPQCPLPPKDTAPSHRGLIKKLKLSGANR